MFFLLDGYNILFSLACSTKPFSTQRQEVIAYFQRQFASLNLSGMLVFDGFHKSNEESGRGYESPLEVVFTPKGQNADSFILEKASLSQNKKDIRIVTNDTGLTRQAKTLGAIVQTNHDFMQYLGSKKKPKEEKNVSESVKNKERLQKIFEDRLK